MLFLTTTSSAGELWPVGSGARCVLVEFTVNKLTSTTVGTDTASTGIVKLFYSNAGFITEDASTYYQPLINEDVIITESMSVDSGIPMTVGDISLSNANGDLDAYLDASKYVWVNGAVNIYYGDPSWKIQNYVGIAAKFELIFTGTILDIDSKDRSTISVKIRDKLQRLNTPITDQKIGVTGIWGTGNQTNQDNTVPLIFGEVFNISPILVDPSQFEYYINYGATERLIEARDNGVPISVTLDSFSTTGKFRLDKPLVGNLTVSAQGQRQFMTITRSGALEIVTGGYSNSVSSAIAVLVTQWGSVNKFSTSEIDVSNFGSFAALNPAPVGIYLTDRANVLEVCNQLASSVGAQLCVTAKGKLRLIKYGSPFTPTVPTTISTDNIIEGTFAIANRTEINAATKIGYAKNWTVQPDLATAIPQAHKDTYSLEWLSVTAKDTGVQSLYKLDAEPEQKDTLLIAEGDATTEATRLNNIFKVTKTTYSFKGTSDLLLLELGQAVTVVHPRFNLAGGVQGQIVSRSCNWTTSTVDTEVLI